MRALWGALVGVLAMLLVVAAVQVARNGGVGDVVLVLVTVLGAVAGILAARKSAARRRP